MLWETVGYQYGVRTVAYSFPGHKTKSKHPKILTPEELGEGYERAKLASKTLGRNITGATQYVKILYPEIGFR